MRVRGSVALPVGTLLFPTIAAAAQATRTRGRVHLTAVAGTSGCACDGDRVAVQSIQRAPFSAYNVTPLAAAITAAPFLACFALIAAISCRHFLHGASADAARNTAQPRGVLAIDAGIAVPIALRNGFHAVAALVDPHIAALTKHDLIAGMALFAATHAAPVQRHKQIIEVVLA